ncbi:MAG: hypothetical protein ISR77_08290 [Pirellulaceae bacterium]|nr:hypothetical protein [Pirellulaceae bacterium]
MAFIVASPLSKLTVWSLGLFHACRSSPEKMRIASGRPELIFSNTAHDIMAVDPATGEVTWEFGQSFLDRAVISPVVAPDLVIAGHGAGIRETRCIAFRPGSSGQAAVPTLAYAPAISYWAAGDPIGSTSAFLVSYTG